MTIVVLLGAAGQTPVFAEQFAYNQLGFLTHGAKIAVLPDTQSGEFWLISAATNSEVLRGPLTAQTHWGPAQAAVKIADFSAFNKPGQYFLRVTGVGDSEPFTVGEGNYKRLLHNLAKTFYLHRVGVPIEGRYGAQYERPAGHPDLLVYRHQRSSVGRKHRVDDSLISSPRGWYDSGDYDKHTVNTAFALYFMLQTLNSDPVYVSKLVLNTPGSINSNPDLVEEMMWAFDWLLTMQDQDGGVFQRLGGKQTPAGLPSEQSDTRYIYPKSTSATLFFAAVNARAYQVFKNHNVLPEYRKKLLDAAERAWRWALENPRELFVQPAAVSSQVYAWNNDDLQDDWAWAGAELALASGNKRYYKAVNWPQEIPPLQWQNVDILALLSVLDNPSAPSELREQAQASLTSLADDWINIYWASGYLVPLSESDFVRDSNYIAVNRAYWLLRMHEHVGRIEYRDAARALFDYLLGRNPLAISYVTSVSPRSPLKVRDWISNYDAVAAPLPGLLVGGPSAHANDPCRYASKAPAKRYIDEWCSEQTNHVSLSGSSALLYVTALLKEEAAP